MAFGLSVIVEGKQMLLYLPWFKVVLRFPYKFPVIYKEPLDCY